MGGRGEAKYSLFSFEFAGLNPLNLTNALRSLYIDVISSRRTSIYKSLNLCLRSPNGTNAYERLFRIERNRWFSDSNLKRLEVVTSEGDYLGGD